VANKNPSPKDRWPKGKSANPGGVPKDPARDPRPMRSIVAELRNQLDSRTLGGKELPRGMTVLDALVQAFLTYALKGNAVLLKEIIDRIDGRLPLPLPEDPAAIAAAKRGAYTVLMPSVAEGKDDAEGKRDADAGPGA
jgi:hypothetical protein